MTFQILRLKDVLTLTGLSRSSIYLQISEGTFPNQISIGKRAVGWEASSIDEWIQQRIDESLKVDKAK